MDFVTEQLSTVASYLPQLSVPEFWSEDEVREDLGSWLNMLASGLICALSGGAGGGTRDMLF